VVKQDFPEGHHAGRSFKAMLRGAILAIAVILIQATVSSGLLPIANNRAEAAFKAVYLANLEGTYSVDGRNTDGSRYSGAFMSPFKVTWRISAGKSAARPIGGRACSTETS
jgi:hypothetical protein